jgi:hypothetical protein
MGGWVVFITNLSIVKNRIISYFCQQSNIDFSAIQLFGLSYDGFLSSQADTELFFNRPIRCTDLAGKAVEAVQGKTHAATVIRLWLRSGRDAFPDVGCGLHALDRKRTKELRVRSFVKQALKMTIAQLKFCRTTSKADTVQVGDRQEMMGEN